MEDSVNPKGTRDISTISKGHGAFFLKRALASKKWHLTWARRCLGDMSKGHGVLQKKLKKHCSDS
jgi:hypothetical protein